MGCGTTTIKYLVFIFNLVFALGGLTLLVIGSIIQWNINNYGEALHSAIAAPSIILIVVGCAIFVIAFLGCCGAIQESYCMIVTFAVLLLVLFVVQLVGGILALVYRESVDEVISRSMQDLMQLYPTQGPEGNIARDFWDDIQHGFQCCGMQGPQDWIGLVTPSPPQSCQCNPAEPLCLGGVYPRGCEPIFIQFMHTAETVLGAIAIAIGVIELVGVIFACTLASAFKRKSSMGV